MNPYGNAPFSHTFSNTIVIYYKSASNFVQWAYRFGNTLVPPFNVANFGYSLKVHTDWNHIYLVGFTDSWKQLAVARAGWVVKFDLVTQKIAGEVSLDISLGGAGTEFIDLELFDDGTLVCAGSFDATAAG